MANYFHLLLKIDWMIHWMICCMLGSCGLGGYIYFFYHFEIIDKRLIEKKNTKWKINVE